MTKQCPSCSKEFIESRETAYRCEDCGWFKIIDDHWHNCPEPAEVTEPAPPKESVVIGPASTSGTDQLRSCSAVPDKPDPQDNVRSYLGGLVTVTSTDEVED